ncbi:unnamed protein product [Bursaphelenchus okinawaensis]|uniref:Uncharacterized protein n=1 Tax=Bursaphelenchus okinawaensis TaxID=465554 RepID=A0A811KJP9_9BILA|nr:unnamed protein product [Bursaphelenchus okinawaensis]CAG9105117.1 unnamed protein product [Bursaphelenchus okinawaensis]
MFLSSMLCWGLFLFINVAIAQKVSVLYDDFDSVVGPLIRTLNISLTYYKDVYNLRTEMELASIQMEPNISLAEKIADSNFLISMTTAEESSKKVLVAAQNSNIPTIQMQLTSWNASYKDEPQSTITDNYVILVPSYLVFDNLLADFVNAMNVTSEITVIYSEEYVRGIQYEWQTPFNSLNVSVDFVKSEETDDLISSQLAGFEQKTKYLMFVTDTSTVEKYVSLGQKQIATDMFTWMVFTKDTMPFKCFQNCSDVQLYWSRVIKTTATEELANFTEFLWSEELDKQFPFSQQTYNHLQTSFCLDVMYTVMRYMLGGNNAQELEIDRDEEAVQVNATVAALLRDESMDYDFGPFRHHFSHYFYQITNGVILKVDRVKRLPKAKFNKLIANWTYVDGLRPKFGGLGIDVRNLTHYRVVTILQEPFVQTGGPDETFGLTGYCIDLLVKIQEQLNFTYEIYEVPDKKFGVLESTGNWNGLIGDLISGQADMAIGPISVIAERETQIDFTVPFYDLVGTTILMKRDEIEYSLFKFLMVLEWPVWLCILGAYLFTSILLWIFDKFSPYSYTNNREKYKDDTEKREFNLKECLWFCMTSLTPQGGGEAPKNISGRLVAATWWLFGFIIIASYTANLAAFLTVARLEQSITSLDDLAKQYKVEYAPLKSGGTETYFRRMAEIEEQFYDIWKKMSLNESMSEMDRAKLAVWDYPVSDKYTNMWRFMVESRLPETAEEAIQRVLTSETGFAFIGDAMEIKYATLTNCKLQQVGQEFSRKPYAVAVQEGSALGSEISKIVLKLLNERQLEALKEQWWHKNAKKQECSNVEDESTGISIQNIGGVFILILGGIMISLVILVVEFFYYKRLEEKNVQKDTAMQPVRGRDGPYSFQETYFSNPAPEPRD